MSHPEQLGFFAATVAANERVIKGGRVLEIGSYDVNGTVRNLFTEAADYLGVDLEAGPGVDLVAFGHEVEASDASFDVAISGECFEHDPHWRDTFANMVRLTRPGGLVAFTCASRGRPEHGTRRTTQSDSPGTQSVGLDYYRNLVADDFSELPLHEWFGDFKFWYLPTSFDLYFAGVRAGGEDAVLPSDVEIQELRRIMPWPHKAARWPLRLMAKTRVTEERYQRIVVPYWMTLLSLGSKRVSR